MTDLLGAGAESSVRVFVCFFLGLALGSALAATRIPRIRRPWRFLAGIEFGVALTCLPILFLPQWAGWVWLRLGPASLVSWPGALVKTALSIALVLPPAFLMGMTLPVLVSAVCRATSALSREAVWLYACNTFGGVIGICWPLMELAV